MFTNENQEEVFEEVDLDKIDALQTTKDSLEFNPEAAVLCASSPSNPYFLSIIYVNKKFCNLFGVEASDLVGKGYDTIFADVNLGYVSANQIEYVKLVKAVKDFKTTISIIDIPTKAASGAKVKFKITFHPINFVHESSRHAIFSFERTFSSENTLENEESNHAMLKNLERTLKKERLLREVGSIIISDMSIKDIAQNIARMLCDYLRADRCLIHDYLDGKTSFVVEHHNEYTKPMITDDKDPVCLDVLSRYINFQNHFHEQYGGSENKSSTTVVENIASDSSFSGVYDICVKYNIASQIAVTTACNDKINGGIYIHMSEPKTWMVDEVDPIEIVADQFSITINRSQSIDRVMIANHALMEKTAQLKEALKKEKYMRKMQYEFVALVSHEFKTPLQIIDSTRELLARKFKNNNILDETFYKALEKIKSGIERMNGLIHSTLNLAKMENDQNAIKLECVKFDIKKFINEIIEKNSNLAISKNVKVIKEINNLPDSFYGDPKLLEHSFGNVVSNAIKYSKDDSIVKIIGKSSEKEISVQIIDQGIGIPAEDLENIGKKFFRAKNTLSIAGTGIGIHLTRHFVELHKGTVKIESQIDVGTTVTITLPITI